MWTISRPSPPHPSFDNIKSTLHNGYQQSDGLGSQQDDGGAQLPFLQLANDPQ